MSMTEEIKRLTAKRKGVLVLDIIQGRTTVAEVSLFYDFSSSFGYRTVVHLLGFNKDSVWRNFQFAGMAPGAARRQALAQLLLGCFAAGLP